MLCVYFITANSRSKNYLYGAQSQDLPTAERPVKACIATLSLWGAGNPS